VNINVPVSTKAFKMSGYFSHL
jgi:hypothetical protein